MAFSTVHIHSILGTSFASFFAIIVAFLDSVFYKGFKILWFEYISYLLSSVRMGISRAVHWLGIVLSTEADLVSLVHSVFGKWQIQKERNRNIFLFSLVYTVRGHIYIYSRECQDSILDLSLGFVYLAKNCSRKHFSEGK